MQTIMVIGGGAAGFFSAIHNKQRYPNSRVVIVEKSSHVLSKVKISGGGRCNVTHACFEPKQLCDYYPRGCKELRGPLHVFQPKDTMAWFELHGVSLKIEADNRVFPVSNSSQEIIDCLVNTARGLDVQIWTQCDVLQVVKLKEGFQLELADGNVHMCQKLVLATGSSRQGHYLAESLGHTIVFPIASLFTFKIDDTALHDLKGLSVADVSVWVLGHKKHAQKGPLLITHWGMSGPSVIKLSAWQAQLLSELGYHTTICVNWLPNLKISALEQECLAYQRQHSKKKVVTHSPFSVIPNRLWRYLVLKSGISDTQIWQTMSRKQCARLAQMVSQTEYQMTGKSAFKEEFVTCGGVSLKEIDFKTMESKCCPGLYIVGELLDIDGVTGGFNFQNAWTTGYISGL